MLSADGDRAVHPAAIFCLDVPFLHSADAPWTEEHLLPCFTWTTPTVATRSWSAFLNGGQWDERTLTLLKPE